MKAHKNIQMLEVIAGALGDLLSKVVFVGGATTALYIDDAAAPSPTPSDDVDCVVQVSSKLDYAKLEMRLRKMGFKDPEAGASAPICRKVFQGIDVDVMPTDESILGFSNRWYGEAVARKMTRQLPSGREIFIFSVPYFLATKLVAYSDRGKSDPRLSQDLEDICAILDGCSHVEQDVQAAAPKVQEFIRKEFLKLIQDEDLFEEAAHGFIRAAGDPVGRVTRLITLARALAIP